MSSFKNRLIQEDYNPQAYGMETKPSLGQRLKTGAKNNWGKLATGAALGAAGTMLGHQFNDGMADFNNDLHTAADQGGLTGWKDELLSKTQHGLDSLKSDGAPSSTSGTSGTGSWAGQHTGSTPTVSGSSVTNPVTGATNASAITPDQIKAMGIEFAGANDSSRGQLSGIFGEGYGSHLKGYFSGEADIDPADMTPDQLARAKYLSAGDQGEILHKYQTALKDAGADGKITSDEADKLSGIKKELDGVTQSPGFLDRILGKSDINDYTRHKLEGELSDSIAFAKDNNLEFLLNGNTDDDMQFFKNMEAKFGKIPDRLLPIYQAVIRSRQG